MSQTSHLIAPEDILNGALQQGEVGSHRGGYDEPRLEKL